MSEKRIGLVGLLSQIENPGEIEINRLYEIVGRNTGNLLFTNAVINQLKGTVERIGYSFDPDQINQEYDVVAIPAANWLGEYVDMGFLADRLEKLTIPCIIVGLGAQSDITGSIPKLPTGSIKLLEVLSDRSEKISLRGYFSAEVLDHYGFKSYTVTGCPSIFMDLNKNQKIVKADQLDSTSNLAIASTRYHLTDALFSEGMANRINWMLFKAGYSLQTDMIFQSEIPEFQLLAKPAVFMEKLAANYFSNGKGAYFLKTYGAPNREAAIDYVKERGKLYFNAQEWIAAMKQYDFLISSRIHGTIAALLAGVPAILLSHDSRTKELADFCGIPTYPVDPAKEALNLEDFKQFYQEVDLKKYAACTSSNYETLKEFYRENDLETNL